MRSVIALNGAASTGRAGKTQRVLAQRAGVDPPAAQRAVRDLLVALGYDPTVGDLVETPRRAAAALAELVTPRPFKITTFANAGGYDDLVLVRDIPFHSVCQHHLLPFVGVAHVGYVPGERIIVGLSKLARVVDYFAYGLQVQERLTTQIANFIRDALKPRGVGVVLEAEHMCMSLRGVQKVGTKTVTSAVLGTLRRNPRAREDFLRRARGARARKRHAATLVSRREAFNAAHQLCDPDLSDEENRRLFGKCVRLHGHNYVVEAAVAGDTDRATGYVMDLKRLSDLMDREIIQHVDHRNLNTDVPWLAGRIPTAENLAAAFWDRLEPHLPGGILHAVRVWESEKNWAEYRGEG